MTLYELIKKYGSDKGLEVMWKATQYVSDFVNKLNDDDYKHLIHRLAGYLLNEHYDEYFADEQVAKMYYVYDGIKHTGPFITKDKVSQKYNDIRSEIKEYNQWDFYVTVQMIYSDNYSILKRWFKDETDEQLQNRVFELSINWLKDEDNPFGTKKIWCYFNSKQ